MRRLKHPEHFTTPEVAIDDLRRVAEKSLRGRSGMVTWTLNLTYATEEEVRANLERKAKAAGKAKR